MQEKIYKGVKNSWIEPADFSTAEYKLLLSIQHPSQANPVEFQSTVENNQYKFEIIPADTEQLRDGYCVYNIRAINLIDADDIQFVSSGVVYVTPSNISSMSEPAYALLMVEKLKAAILSLSSKTTQSIVIDGDSYSYQDIDKLTKQLDYWERKAGIKKQVKVLARFVNE